MRPAMLEAAYSDGEMHQDSSHPHEEPLASDGSIRCFYLHGWTLHSGWHSVLARPPTPGQQTATTESELGHPCRGSVLLLALRGLGEECSAVRAISRSPQVIGPFIV